MTDTATLTIFAEDSQIANAAESIGMAVIRRPTIDVDPRELPAQYLKAQPDWARIRRDLEAGVEIPGARLTGQTEYVVHRRGADV